jgi:hypothetical protein
VKTPIRNPLWTTKANNLIEGIVPTGSVVASYYFFSGGTEFHLSNRKRFVSAHTTKQIVYDVWETIFEDPLPAANIATRILPFKDEKDFPLLQENWNRFSNPDVRAALFFFLNNCSDSGYISKGNIDLKNYNPVSLSRLRKFTKPENFHLSKIENVEESIENNNCDFYFFQMPKYRINLLTGGINRGAEEDYPDFKQIFEVVKNKKYVILTKPSQHLKEIHDFNKIFVDKYGRQTTEEKAEELIIYNV